MDQQAMPLQQEQQPSKPGTIYRAHPEFSAPTRWLLAARDQARYVRPTVGSRAVRTCRRAARPGSRLPHLPRLAPMLEDPGPVVLEEILSTHGRALADARAALAGRFRPAIHLARELEP
jgi:hypothetical protein